MVIGFLVLLMLPDLLNVYHRSFIMFTMMYVILSSSWNIISGFTGYISFGHVMFYGVGSYASAILVADHGWPWLLSCRSRCWPAWSSRSSSDSRCCA